MKWKKQLWVFVYLGIKNNGKFWSVSLELFVERKPLISEEWHTYEVDIFLKLQMLNFSFLSITNHHAWFECDSILLLMRWWEREKERCVGNERPSSTYLYRYIVYASNIESQEGLIIWFDRIHLVDDGSLFPSLQCLLLHLFMGHNISMWFAKPSAMPPLITKGFSHHSPFFSL